MTKLIILDRDGVINYDSDDYIKSPEEWIAIPSSLQALALLKQKGYTVALATNQSGIGRGYYTEATLTAIHKKMHQQVEQAGGEIDFIAYCPHLPDARCDCRKPKTGLLEQIQKYYQLDSLKDIPFIGDSLKDLQAGERMQCQPVLVKTGKGENTFTKGKLPSKVLVANSLLGYVTNIS